MGVGLRAIAGLVVLALVVGGIAPARAQPGISTSEILREANATALAGDWPRVVQLVEPLLQRSLAVADLGEAHRLAGIAAFFQQRPEDAEAHFVAFLRIDLDGRLDPALYPPEVLGFFNDVASRHAAELRAQRIQPRRSWLLTLIPPAGQFQNGEHTKAFVLGGTLAALLITNLTTYALLRAWCDHTDGPAGGGLNCDDGKNRNSEAAKLRPFNIASGIGFLVVYAYGVYDGVRGYRQRSREQTLQPFVATSPDRHLIGISGSF